MERLPGPDAGGRLRLDMRGLRPGPAAALGVDGVAVATLATVLGFDLGCLAANACGVGLAPPSLIHDSPEETDMEPALDDRLSRLAQELERAHDGRTPAFQYIAIATSPPPPEVASGPCTRLVLDARVPEGHLPGRRS